MNCALNQSEAMFAELGEYSQNMLSEAFLDPEYNFDEYFQLGLRRKVRPIKNQLASLNTSN